MWLACLLQIPKGAMMKKTAEEIEWEETKKEWEALIRAVTVFTGCEYPNIKPKETE
jgi:hypothetical protein